LTERENFLETNPKRLVLDEGVSIETALAEAKEIGLRVDWIEEKAIDYIKRKQSPTINGEVSVRPGINKKFVDASLDVDDWVKKFAFVFQRGWRSRKRFCG